MDGALMEIGPFRTQNGTNLVLNEGSWSKFANLLFVDQPVGVGLSTSNPDSYLHELPEVATAMLKFLDNYFSVFPDQRLTDLYIAGESYAGQYIPYIADAIVRRNKEINDNQENSKYIGLKGIMMGNAWVDPRSQYGAYRDYAYEKGLVQRGTATASKLESYNRQCENTLKKLDKDVPIHVNACENILDVILEELYLATGLPASDPKACLNMYDIRLTDTFSSCGMNWPPDLDSVMPYLRRDDVLKALNIDPSQHVVWHECSPSVGSAFQARNSTYSGKLIPGLIESGVPVLMFNGDQDLICNYIGNKRVIGSMQWGGERSSGFQSNEPEIPWYVDGVPSGTYQTGRNMTFIKVFNASHMVPFDLPQVSQTMLNQFLGIPGYKLEGINFNYESELAEFLSGADYADPRVDADGNPMNNDDNFTDSEDNMVSGTEDDEGKFPAPSNNSTETTDGEESYPKATWKDYKHEIAVGIVAVLFISFFLYMLIKRNGQLVSSAVQSNRARVSRFAETDAEQALNSEMDAGLISRLKHKLTEWRAGRSRNRGYPEEEDAMLLSTMRTREPSESRTSNSSFNSIMESESDEDENKTTRSDVIV